MDGVVRALEHFRGSGVRAFALVPEKWHRSGGIFSECPNPRVMTEDAWAILDVLVREGSAELLPESHLSDGETLLNYALRREFVGGVVTNDRMQFRAALERAEGEPAASAARLAFAHHLVPYAFEGAEMRFSTRAHAESSESSESPGIAGVGFRGTRRGDFEEIAPRRARTRREGETRGETSSPRGRRAPLRAWTRRTPRPRRRRSASRTRRTGSTRRARRRRRRRRRERRRRRRWLRTKPPRERCTRDYTASNANAKVHAAHRPTNARTGGRPRPPGGTRRGETRVGKRSDSDSTRGV